MKKYSLVIEPQLNGFFKVYEATQNLQMVTIP
ncbi:hypothetical protein GGR32_000853 [Mesonia hippocampi]|uniref:Uncharacterized protein n=1 Tax=Mesonia hippocampi TaxID=1628250 RepID=A0A840EPP2_9FLAO|nr:hypothetical protein [Mesonia hippocampi]